MKFHRKKNLFPKCRQPMCLSSVRFGSSSFLFLAGRHHRIAPPEFCDDQCTWSPWAPPRNLPKLFSAALNVPVMMPLDTVTNAQSINNPNQIAQWFEQLKAVGVDGFD